MTSATPLAIQELFLYTGQERATIPKDVTRIRVHSSVKIIPPHAFLEQTKLEVVELCEGLEEIGEHAFHGCVSLRSIIIPSTVAWIFNYAFHNCTMLEYVELGEGLLKIGAGAFSFCALRQHIVIPTTVTTIRIAAFFGAALSSIDLPDGLDSICHNAFVDTRLQHIRIPPLVTIIPAMAFSSEICNYYLFSVELPKRLDQIGGFAFQNCQSLRNIAIPTTSMIHDGAFDNARDLQKLFVSASRINGELRNRFHRLPIHRMMYYQSYHTAETILKNLNAAIDQGLVYAENCSENYAKN